MSLVHRWLKRVTQPSLGLFLVVTGACTEAEPAVDADTTPAEVEDLVEATADAAADVTADGRDAALPDVDDAAADIAPTDASDARDDVDPSDGASDGIASDVVGPRCGDGQLDPDEACDDGDTDDLDGCDRACEVGTALRPPRPGEVLVNELMVAPFRAAGSSGEWIELVNLTDEPLNLSSCVLADEGTDRIALDLEGGLVHEAGDFLVLSPEPSTALNGGLTVDVPYATMLLDDLSDEVILDCDGVVDGLAWTPFAWPIIAGRALALDPSRRTLADNDRVDSWCPSDTRFGRGDFGTPGTPNPSCPQLDREIDACRIDVPALVTGFRDAPVAVDVRLTEAGLTDLSSGVDSHPQLVVEVGLGRLAADVSISKPLEDRDFEALAWSGARPAPGYLAPPGSLEDAWRAEVSPADTGALVLIARASRDGGASWRTCDRDGDPVTAASLPVLLVSETPCYAGACASPPAPTCAPDGVMVEGFALAGRCVPTRGDAFDCTYDREVTDCGALGRACRADGGTADCARVPRSPGRGDVIVTEVMRDPTGASTEADGQWLELTSTVDEPLNLTGCTLLYTEGGDTTPSPLDEATVLARDGRLVIGREPDFSRNGGVILDRTWSAAIVLGNEGSLTLECGELIDEVAWDEDWPPTPGLSLSLSPFRLDASANDDATSWCPAGLDRGTPGDPNPPCPGDLLPVDLCQLLPPTALTPDAGTPFEVAAKVIARSLTGRTIRTDPSPRVRLEVGLAATGALPATLVTWTPATPDLVWTTSGQNVDIAEDRYRATVRAPSAASSLYLRASADGGNSWSVCDLDGVLTAGLGRPVSVAARPSPCDPDPCIDDGQPRCREVASGEPIVVIGRGDPTTCNVEAGAARCTFTEVVVEDCSKVGATCAEGRCVGHPRTPEPGDLVLSELMIAPLQGVTPNELGEWVELQSVTTDALDLTGCTLESGGPLGVESWTVPSPPNPLAYVVKAGEVLTFARSAITNVNGGASPAAIWANVALGNAADWVALRCGDAEVDRVNWSVAEGWPVTLGKSLQLSRIHLENQDNDFSSHWCAPGASTPKRRNLACPVDRVLEDCRLLAADAEIEAGLTVDVGVRVVDLGITDVRPVTDPAYGMEVEVGLGPASEDPRSSNRWTWTELAAGEASEGLADLWRGGLTPNELGDFRMLARVSLDGGLRWSLCGPDGPVDDPARDRAARLTILPGVCLPNPCNNPPAPSCAGTMLSARANPGECAIVNGAPSCTYPTLTQECALFGGCSSFHGSCVNMPARPNTARSVIFTEVMRDSTLPPPDKGEWVELHNPGDEAFDLRGCRFIDDAGRAFEVASPVPIFILPDRHAVFATSTTGTTNGGIPTTSNAVRAFGLTLENGVGGLALECDSIEIDVVHWDLDWPGRTGVAMQRDRLSFGRSDVGPEAWCEASVGYGSAGNIGTPGALNLACP